MTRFAAHELQTYIEKISGAVLPIVTEPSAGSAAIYVGGGTHADRLGVEVNDLKYGAYRIASGPNWLLLAGPNRDFEPIEPYRRDRGAAETQRVEQEWDKITGNTFSIAYDVNSKPFDALGVYFEDDTGTLNAVYDFLRGLGVRWYFPGDIGEIIPRKADLVSTVEDRTVRPDFELRQIEFWNTQRWTREDYLWALRLGIYNGSGLWPQSQAVHGMKFVHGRDEYKREHPDHYALWDGVRATTHKGIQGAPCLSSPGLFENHLRYARAMFDHYDEPMLSIDPVDGYSVALCECADCQKQLVPEMGQSGRFSNYVWGYVNRLAVELYKTHPDRKVSGLAYATYQDPPRNIAQMSPNLAVLISAGRYDDPEARKVWQQKRKAWLAVLPSRELYATGHFYTQARPVSRGLPEYFPHLIAANLRELKEDVRGERAGVYTHRTEQPYHEFAIQHLNLYVTTRLWWDVNQDLEALLEEYYTLFYGPARDAMKAFIEYSERNAARMRSDLEPIRRAQALFEEARKAAPPESVYAARIQLVADYLLLESFAEVAGRKRENVPKLRALGNDYSHIAGIRWELDGKTLDGRIDDERHWPPMDRFQPLVDLQTGEVPTLATQFRVFVRAGYLVFGVYCEEPDLQNLSLGDPKNGKEGIRAGDFVELLLETSSHSYYRITVNPAGILIDADCGEGVTNMAWVSGAEAAVFHGEGYWSAEIRVPLAGQGARLLDPLVGVDGRPPTADFPWYFNVGRQRVRDGKVERAAFSPTGSDELAVPERFAELWSRFGQ